MSNVGHAHRLPRTSKSGAGINSACDEPFQVGQWKKGVKIDYLSTLDLRSTGIVGARPSDTL
jgi:hypothetical protein